MSTIRWIENIWMLARCHFQYNDLYGTDISSVDVAALYRNVVLKLEPSSSPHILLIIKGRLMGHVYTRMFQRLGIRVTICSDPLVAYQKYLQRSNVAAGQHHHHVHFDMVIADWSLSGSSTFSYDVLQFIRRDGDSQTCFVALCGKGVLVGNTVRSGADLFFRKPLILHLETLRQLLLPRSMALHGFPVTLLRQPANHARMRKVLGYDATDDDNGDSSVHGVSMRGGDPTAVLAANTAAVQQLVRDVMDEVEMDEADCDQREEVFIHNMLDYIRQQQPEYSNRRWHQFLKDSMKSLSHARETLKRVTAEAAVSRKQAEYCWVNHRDIESNDKAFNDFHGLSRHELIVKCLRFHTRNEELQRVLSIMEDTFSQVTKDDAALQESVRSILRFYELSHAEALEEKRRQTIEVERKRQARRSLALSTSSGGGGGGGSDSVYRATPHDTNMVAPSASRAIITPTRPPLDAALPSSVTGRIVRRDFPSLAPPPPAPPSAPQRPMEAICKSDTGFANVTNGMSRRVVLSTLCRDLEKMVMEREDTYSTKRESMLSSAQESEIAFTLPWPPMLRTLSNPSQKMYRNVSHVLERVLKVCTTMSGRVLECSPGCASILEDMDKKVHAVLGNDPTEVFRAESSSQVPGALTINHSGSPSMSSPGGALEPPSPPPTKTKKSLSIMPKQTSAPPPPLLPAASSNNFTSVEGDGPAGAITLGRVSAMSVSQIQFSFHRFLAQQISTMTSRNDRRCLSSYYCKWFGFVRGKGLQRQVRSDRYVAEELNESHPPTLPHVNTTLPPQAAPPLQKQNSKESSPLVSQAASRKGSTINTPLASAKGVTTSGRTLKNGSLPPSGTNSGKIDAAPSVSAQPPSAARGDSNVAPSSAKTTMMDVQQTAPLRVK